MALGEVKCERRKSWGSCVTTVDCRCEDASAWHAKSQSMCSSAADNLSPVEILLCASTEAKRQREKEREKEEFVQRSKF